MKAYTVDVWRGISEGIKLKGDKIVIGKAGSAMGMFEWTVPKGLPTANKRLMELDSNDEQHQHAVLVKLCAHDTSDRLWQIIDRSKCESWRWWKEKNKWEILEQISDGGHLVFMRWRRGPESEIVFVILKAQMGRLVSVTVRGHISKDGFVMMSREEK